MNWQLNVHFEIENDFEHFNCNSIVYVEINQRGLVMILELNSKLIRLGLSSGKIYYILSYLRSKFNVLSVL